LAIAQTSTVSGTVIAEEDGEPVAGASVVIKGTTTGTMTDIDGKFQLTNLPASAKTLVITFVGMHPQEESIKPSMNIVLKTNVTMMDEVLVVAFGEQKRSSFTGSAGVVSSDIISKRQVTNAMDALSGQISGVQLTHSSGAPGSTPSIRIRGVSSINAGNSPLVVLDGIPYNGSVNNINPADIESITVLKDAASNALYGARGANGVIMVTTKTAKRGDAIISVDAKWGLNSRAMRMYDYLDDPGQYYELNYKSLYNYYTNKMSMSPFDAHKKANETLPGSSEDGGLQYMVFSVPENEYLIGQNGRLNPNATLGNIINYKGQDYLIKPDDWLKEGYREALRQEYNVSVNGGGEKTQIYASFGYLNNKGVVYGSDYSRYSTRIKATYQAKKWMKLGVNASYVNSNENEVSEGSSTSLFGHMMSMPPIYPVYVRDGEGNILRDEHGPIYDYGKGNNAGLSRPSLPNTNPLQTNRLNTNLSKSNAFNGTGFIDIMFHPDLKFTFNAGVYNREKRTNSANNPFYGSSASTGGYVSVSHGRSFTLNLQQLLNYRKTFNNAHSVAILLGHESYRTESTSLSGSKTMMYSYYDNKELYGAINMNKMDSHVTNYNTEGYLFRGQYDYKEKYFGSASYRRDGSSRFHPDHCWGNFWSVGGAWIVNKEEWFTPKWVDMLKVKASYGSQGNDDIGNYRYDDSYDLENVNGEMSIIFNNKGNKNITWETNSNFNTGIEFELFKDKLDGSIDYFYRKTTDMLSKISVPYSMGYGSYYSNIGNMENKGIEIDLKSTIIRNRDWEWSVNLNMTHYKNKVLRLADERHQKELEGHWGYNDGSYFIAEGLPIYTWYLRKFAGINEEGLSTWYMTDSDTGETTTTTTHSNATQYLCGSPMPDVYGGFGTTVSFKGFDLSLGFSYSIGGKVMDSGYQSSLTLGGRVHKDILKSWTPDNKSDFFPRLQYNDQSVAGSSDKWLTDASWLNFQNITFGYTVPRTFLKKMDISSLRVYVTCDNIAFFSKRKGFDPSQSLSGSQSLTRYSPMRVVTAGINLKF